MIGAEIRLVLPLAADGVPRRIVQRDADGGYVTTTEYFGFGEPAELAPPSAGP
jgi:hypothetical protein